MKTNIKQQRPIIKCPHCGGEYLPCELFMPGDLIGKSDTIVRDALGKIIYEDYHTEEEPIYTTSYECDNCNKAFVVSASISYKSKEEIEELDFSSDTTSLLG